jgi:hypothetical protein
MSEMSKLREFLNQEVDLPKLLKALSISDEGFEMDNIRQAKLMQEAGRLRAQALYRLKRLEARYKKLSAETALGFRRKKYVDGKGSGRGGQYTEGAIANMVTCSSRVQRALKRLDRAYQLDEYAKQLVEAYRERQMSLKIMSDNRSSEMFAQLRLLKDRMALDDVRQKARRVQER